MLVLCGSAELVTHVTTVWHKFDRMIMMIITDCDQALWHALIQNSTVVFETPYCTVIDQPLSAGSTQTGCLLEQINLVSMVLVSQAGPTCTSPQLLSVSNKRKDLETFVRFSCASEMHKGSGKENMSPQSLALNHYALRCACTHTHHLSSISTYSVPQILPPSLSLPRKTRNEKRRRKPSRVWPIYLL